MAGGRGHPAKCQEPVHGFPWAWDEEVVEAAEQVTARQSGLLAAASPVVAGAIAEAALLQGVPWVAVPGRDLDVADEKDAKAVEAQAVARQELAEWPAQQIVLPQESRTQAVPRGRQAPMSQPVLEQRVLLQGPLAQERRPAAQQARASRPRVRGQEVQRESQRVPEPLVSVRREGAPAQLEEQEERREREPMLARAAFVAPLLPPLPSRNVRLPRRFRHPLHPSGDA